MKNAAYRLLALALMLVMAVGLMAPAALAAAPEDEAVANVIAQLEAIDTLQQMQDKRENSAYSTKVSTSLTEQDQANLEKHAETRALFEAYISEMFAARAAAQMAYDALTGEQKAQIDPALVAKLDDDLATAFYPMTISVTPADDEYVFDAVSGGSGYSYEVSNHMVSGKIVQTFILVDTSDGKTSWTPNGLYEYGKSNYDVVYCCDVKTELEYEKNYKRVNLEDSGYYGKNAASKIRAILLNAYPFVSVEQMRSNLKAGGLSSTFVDSLSREDMIAAVQMAVWTFANAGDFAANGLNYHATLSVRYNNPSRYFTVLHDYTNETWYWQGGAGIRTFDTRAQYRVNTLAYYLCNLPGVEAQEDELLITDVEVTRAELISPSEDGDLYQVGMYVSLDYEAGENDKLKVIATSTDADGVQTNYTSQAVGGRNEIEMMVRAKAGDTIKVTVEGTQHVDKGVYFYEPEGGRDASQSLVGVGEGETKVSATKTFKFSGDIEQGLRIYKTAAGTLTPLSDIPFHVYRVEGTDYSEIPTEEEIAKYAAAENLIGSVKTDATGYAALAIKDIGTYLVVEEHNAEKVKAPVAPFYIQIPMDVSVTSEDGTTEMQPMNIVSVYPKNEPTLPPEEPPVIPPVPDKVVGRFELYKHDKDDESAALEGAQFEVYEAAADDQEATKVVVCGGVQYAVKPVMVNGSVLTLTTNENGYAQSPELDCGTYFLVETVAPAGYNLSDEAFSVTVVSSEIKTVCVKIPNQAGVLLPETGGNGTAAFALVGCMAIALAAAMLAMKKRAVPNK